MIKGLSRRKKSSKKWFCAAENSTSKSQRHRCKQQCPSCVIWERRDKR